MHFQSIFRHWSGWCTVSKRRSTPNHNVFVRQRSPQDRRQLSGSVDRWKGHGQQRQSVVLQRECIPSRHPWFCKCIHRHHHHRLQSCCCSLIVVCPLISPKCWQCFNADHTAQCFSIFFRPLSDPWSLQNIDNADDADDADTMFSFFFRSLNGSCR